MRPAELIRRASDYLEWHGVESYRATAEVLLASVLGIDRAGLYARAEALTPTEARSFGRALCQRCTGTPLQHLTGEQAFRRITLAVRAGVFVPRPETEILVEVALALLDERPSARVADVGTGTGAIALAIADERPGARVVAADLSTEAVSLARENATALGLPVEVFEGDGLAPLPQELRRTLDLVVSNPPYVAREEYEALPPEVKADPSSALIGGPEIHARIAEEATSWLKPGGGIALEIGSTQADDVLQILVEAGYDGTEITPDLAGRDRVVSGRLR